MKRQNKNRLFFEGRLHSHHFATEEDVAEEFTRCSLKQESFIYKMS